MNDPRLRIVLTCSAICLAVAGWQGARLVSMSRWNRLIESGRVSGDVAHAPPEVRFAAAYSSARTGAVQESLDTYRALLADAGDGLRHDAMFNAGTLYLQQAAAARSASDGAAAGALAELAKASYRELLREDDDWDARYNLEKTLRLAPDPEGEDEGFYTPPAHLRFAPAAPGTTLGLP